MVIKSITIRVQVIAEMRDVDGIVEVNVEQCDDGNIVTDDCTMVNANAKYAPQTVTSVKVGWFCGDGVVHNSFKQCDDGNSLDDDGCSNDWWIRLRRRGCSRS